jgi:hypothetical protein
METNIQTPVVALAADGIRFGRKVHERSAGLLVLFALPLARAVCGVLAPAQGVRGSRQIGGEATLDARELRWKQAGLAREMGQQD